jgi:hypothetical protein
MFEDASDVVATIRTPDRALPVRKTRLDNRSHDLHNRGPEQPPEAGRELQRAPLGRELRVLLLGDPNEKVVVVPQDPVKHEVRVVGSEVGLGQQACHKVGPGMVNLVRLTVGPRGAATSREH